MCRKDINRLCLFYAAVSSVNKTSEGKKLKHDGINHHYVAHIGYLRLDAVWVYSKGVIFSLSYDLTCLVNKIKKTKKIISSEIH